MTVVKPGMVLCASVFTFICDAKEPPMNDIKTYCVGRYQADVPADAQINGEDYRYRFGKIYTDESSGTAADFQRRMDDRDAQFKAGKHKDKFALVGSRRPSPNSRVFEFSKHLFVGPSAGFSAYVWEAGNTFSMEETGYEPSQFGNIVAELKTKLLPNLHARPSSDIPTQPGFCLKNGFIANDGSTPQFEAAAISFKFAQWPGVLLTVRTMTVTKLGQPSLLQRIDNSGLHDTFKDLMGQIKLLRRGPRTINGRAGEEILMTLPTDGGYRLHQFHWEAPGTALGNGLEPTITVELESGMTRENGEPVRPRLTDEQAVALFDAVADSVRPRPVHESKLSGGDSRDRERGTLPPAPLGTLAQTGTVCPQSGWWTCPEAVAHEIEGGARQRFDAGTIMPSARVVAQRSWFQRLTGRQRKHDVNTVWKLMGYDTNGDAPTSH